MVNLTDSNRGAHALTLTQADDPIHITKPSDVNFGDAITTIQGRLDRFILEGTAIPFPPPFNTALVERIARAGKNNPAMEPTPKKLINQYWP